MEIFILRDGQQTGPFSEDDTQQMLKQGTVSITDLACRPGMTDWIPLHSVLYPGPAAQSVESPAPVPATSSGPATEKQKAFLRYVGLAPSDTLTKEEAALIVNDAMENPKNATRVAKWNTERLTLHPDLFAEELQARKEQRIQHYFEVCQTDGAEILDGITKAHCQVLVGYLDVKFPGWDGNPAEAPHDYFFPAVAEKFPQLVRPEWKGKLQAPKTPKVAPEVKRHAAGSKPVTSPVRKKSSPFGSLVKGFFIGLILVGLAGAGLYLYSNPGAREELLAKVKGHSAAAESQPPAEAPKPESSPEEAPAPENAPAETPEAVPMVAAAAPAAPAPEAKPEAAPAVAAPAPVPAPPPAPMAEATPPPAPAAPAETAPAAPGGMVLFDPTPAPAKSAGEDAMPAEPAAAPEKMATLTKVFEVRSEFGVVKIPAGTKLPVVEQDGLTLKVRFQNQVIAVPLEATDLAAQSLF